MQSTKTRDLQHAGEVHGNALQQHAVRPQLGTLPVGNVRVALTNQDPHLLHGSAGVHVVTESLVDSRLPVVETTPHKWRFVKGLRRR